jgi:DNA-binding response OmpR family regulator
MREDRANFLAIGCDDYLSKPFKLSELLELIRRYTTLGDTIPNSGIAWTAQPAARGSLSADYATLQALLFDFTPGR